MRCIPAHEDMNVLVNFLTVAKGRCIPLSMKITDVINMELAPIFAYVLETHSKSSGSLIFGAVVLFGSLNSRSAAVTTRVKPRRRRCLHGLRSPPFW